MSRSHLKVCSTFTRFSHRCKNSSESSQDTLRIPATQLHPCKKRRTNSWSHKEFFDGIWTTFAKFSWMQSILVLDPWKSLHQSTLRWMQKWLNLSMDGGSSKEIAQNAIHPGEFNKSGSIWSKQTCVRFNGSGTMFQRFWILGAKT